MSLRGAFDCNFMLSFALGLEAIPRFERPHHPVIKPCPQRVLTPVAWPHVRAPLEYVAAALLLAHLLRLADAQQQLLASCRRTLLAAPEINRLRLQLLEIIYLLFYLLLYVL